MLFFRSDDEEEDTMSTEEVKKPKVIVDNKPLIPINCADGDDHNDEKPENSNTMNQNQEKKKKKKNKKKINNNVGNSTAPEVSQSTGEKDSKNVIIKPEKVKLATQVQKISQPLKSIEQKISKKIEKDQVKQKDRLSKVTHKTIDKRNKQNKQKSMHLSDERLKAFGINPKKFVKQQKYAARNNNQQNSNIKTPKKTQVAQKKQTIKLKNKLKKVLKSSK